jgi:hypothetical protein
MIMKGKGRPGRKNQAEAATRTPQSGPLCMREEMTFSGPRPLMIMKKAA